MYELQCGAPHLGHLFPLTCFPFYMESGSLTWLSGGNDIMTVMREKKENVDDVDNELYLMFLFNLPSRRHFGGL